MQIKNRSKQICQWISDIRRVIELRMWLKRINDRIVSYKQSFLFQKTLLGAQESCGLL